MQNKLDLQYFLDSGLLQEVNRQFFHPRGLAMFVSLDDDGKVKSIAGIYSEQEDLGGFCLNKIDQDKVKNVKKMTRKFSKRRRELFGNIIQKKDYPENV